MRKIRTKFIGVELYCDAVKLIYKHTKARVDNLFPQKSDLNFIHGEIHYIESLFVGETK